MLIMQRGEEAMRNSRFERRQEERHERWQGRRFTSLYRDRSDRVIGGVCSGLAHHFGWNVVVVRVLAALSLFTPLAPFTVVAYIVGMISMPKVRSTELYKNAEEERFWRSASAAPSSSFGELRYRYREMENRLRNMEAYITSSTYEFDRELGRAGPPKPPSM
jgi:phage shock protein C